MSKNVSKKKKIVKNSFRDEFLKIRKKRKENNNTIEIQSK